MLSTELLARQAIGRTDLLREAILDTEPALCSERARLMTESYRESEGEPTILRKARAFARILEGMSIYIHPGELVVGNQASRPRAAPIFPEYSVDWLLQEMDDFPTRPLDQFQVSEEAKAELQEAMATNFQGQHGEEVRQLLLNKAPKFGNDDDYVDLLTKKVADCFAEAIHGLATVRGAMGPPPSLSLPTSLRVGLPGRPPTAGGPEGR